MSNVMFCSSFRRRIISLLAVGLVLSGLAACSALRFGYSQAPSVLYWWLDGYVDFTDEQTPKAREHISDFFSWHRKTQLPDYVALLGRARKEVLLNATHEQACGWAEEARVRIQTSLRHWVPSGVDVGRTLSEAQLQHMIKKFNEVNEKRSNDFLQPDLRQRRKAAVKRAVDRAESIYGSLHRGQRELIAKGIEASPFNPEAWMTERQQRQKDLLATLRALPHMSPPEASKAMTAWVDSYQHSPRPAYLSNQQQLMQYNCELAARIHNSTTAEQRATAADRLKGWEDDLRSLATSMP